MYITVIIIVGIGLVLGIGIWILGTMQTDLFSFNTAESDTQTILSSSTDTLSPVGEGITSSEVKANNDTWLDFNSTAEDYVIVTLDVANSTTFWYKNETSDWIFVANASGTNYTNGVVGNPNQYPVFYNGSDYFIGKTDATTFFNGSIDNFRVYGFKLNVDLVEYLYSRGRY